MSANTTKSTTASKRDRWVEHRTGGGLPFSFRCVDGTVVVVTPLPPEAAQVCGMGPEALLVTVVAVRDRDGELRATGGRVGRPSITTEGGRMDPAHVTGRPGWDRMAPETLQAVAAGVNRGGTLMSFYVRELELAETSEEATGVAERWRRRFPEDEREAAQEALALRLETLESLETLERGGR